MLLSCFLFLHAACDVTDCGNCLDDADVCDACPTEGFYETVEDETITACTSMVLSSHTITNNYAF